MKERLLCGALVSPYHTARGPNGVPFTQRWPALEDIYALPATMTHPTALRLLRGINSNQSSMTEAPPVGDMLRSDVKSTRSRRFSELKMAQGKLGQEVTVEDKICRLLLV